MYAVELALPFLLFFPGNIRRIALLGQLLLQFAILLSGNYGFFNLLTMVLCIPLCDDRMFAFLSRERIKVTQTEALSKFSTGFWIGARTLGPFSGYFLETSGQGFTGQPT